MAIFLYCEITANMLIQPSLTIYVATSSLFTTNPNAVLLTVSMVTVCQLRTTQTKTDISFCLITVVFSLSQQAGFNNSSCRLR